MAVNERTRTTILRMMARKMVRKMAMMMLRMMLMMVTMMVSRLLEQKRLELCKDTKHSNLS